MPPRMLEYVCDRCGRTYARASWRAPRAYRYCSVLCSNRAHTRLTPEIVAEIRQRYVPGQTRYAELAADYGVSQSVISAVIRGVDWLHASGSQSR